MTELGSKANETADEKVVTSTTWRNADFLHMLERKVLVIGAGGIGCELLKNLALTGFKNICVIDLDTIDISNLNRQFLFRREHVGKSKAEVAAAAVKGMCPSMNIVHYHDSITSEKFGIDFFKQHAIVLSALDNRAARSHVNRLCLVAGVPLVESGSAGYLGQVGVILKGKTECYDCVEKTAQKTFPNCTIRNTPSELIHCVVWAKSLFNQLFGEADPDDDVSPEMPDEEAEMEEEVVPTKRRRMDEQDGKKGKLDGEATVTKDANHSNGAAANGVNGNGGEKKKGISTRVFAEKHEYAPAPLFDKLFHEDINYLLSMADLWRDREKPQPVRYGQLAQEDWSCAGPSREPTNNDNWSLSKWLEAYTEAVGCLHERYKEAVGNSSVLTWDKDDEPAMNFVAACANIRAHVFHIQMKPLFEIKSMAGNIIPAIATTNACVSGMIVIEALKVLRGDLDNCKSVYLKPQPNPRGKILVDETTPKPNPRCYVCSSKGEVLLRLNLERMLTKQFREIILLGALGMRSPDVTDLFTHRILISSEEGETDDVMSKTLSSVGVQAGTQLDVDDFSQQLQFKIILFHSPEFEPLQYSIEGEKKS